MDCETCAELEAKHEALFALLQNSEGKSHQFGIVCDYLDDIRVDRDAHHDLHAKEMGVTT